MPDSRSLDALERLKAVRWDGVDVAFEHARSRAHLMREHLRRMALWAVELRVPASWPFFNVPELLESDLRLDSAVAEELDQYIWDNIGLPSTERVCRGAVQWGALSSETVGERPDLPEPYEPILRMCERGGGYFPEGHFIDLTGVMIPHGTLQDHLSRSPVVAMEDSVLDALDAG